MQLEIEEAALAKEKDKASKARLKELRKQLQDLKGQEGALREQYESEKQAIQEVRDMRCARTSRSCATRWRRPSGIYDLGREIR